MYHTVYIGLGSNIGRRPSNLRRAIRALAGTAGIAVEKISSFYETSPVGPDQRDFINAVARIRTHLAPLALLKVLKRIEKEMGRRPGKRWGPRTIDLDILLYDRRTLKSRKLTVPHPRMHERLFVLMPLAEIAPKTLERTVAGLPLKVPLTGGKQKVKIFSRHHEQR